MDGAFTAMGFAETPLGQGAPGLATGLAIARQSGVGEPWPRGYPPQKRRSRLTARAV